MRELRADLDRAQADNEALVRELTSIRHGSAAKITPELAAQTYTLKQITLGRGTGGVDEDACPGDEALEVVVEPRDADGHTIKAPGSVHVEALEISGKHRGAIHLMVTDVVMPHMNGRDLAERMRQMRPQMKVIYMSGYTDNLVLQGGMLEEGSDFIQKPFSADILARRVRAALQQN